MIKEAVVYVSLLCAGLWCAAPSWAESPTTCAYESSGVDLQKFKTSRHVMGFEQIEKKARYSGNLKKVGGFYLELFGCTHYGARLTVLLGPDDDVASVSRALNILPDLLFSAASSKQVKKALADISTETLLTPVHLPDLAKDLGLSDLNIQMLDTDGMGVLVFEFYGG